MLRSMPGLENHHVWTLRPDSIVDDAGLFASSAHQLLMRLRGELDELRPQLVIFPASSLPWESELPIDSKTIQFIKVIAEHDVAAGLTCRSVLSQEAMDQLADCREHVRVNVPVMSADVTLQKALEPHAAMLPERLQMAAELRKRGVQVQICVAPIMPNLTDTRENFEPLLERVAKSGADSISAGYLYLRPGQKDAVQRALEPHGWSELVLSAFGEPRIVRESGEAKATLLSKARRQRGYALLMSIAADFGIEVRLSRTANPDFQRNQAPDRVSSARFQSFIRSLRRKPR
jgi:DNA repair photolyase